MVDDDDDGNTIKIKSHREAKKSRGNETKERNLLC